MFVMWAFVRILNDLIKSSRCLISKEVTGAFDEHQLEAQRSEMAKLFTDDIGSRLVIDKTTVPMQQS